MAVVPICHRIPNKYQTQPILNVIRQSERGLICECIAFSEGPRIFSSVSSDMCSSWRVSYFTSDILTKTKTRGGIGFRGLLRIGGFIPFKTTADVTVLRRVCLTESHLRSISENYSQRENFCTVWYASESGSNEKQLRSLDSYLGKLQDDSDTSNKTMELHSGGGQFKSKNGLDSLDAYIGKLNKDANSENYASSTFVEHSAEDNHKAEQFSISEDSKRGVEEKLKSYMELRSRNGGSGRDNSQDLELSDETSNLYLISVLLSINIAVLLFEIASPINNSDLELFSLPSLYGAKINDLILIGEWWRLVTPMFLHSGLVHIALGCWALLTFGPRVCRGYGSFTFFLIYILGGISGNLTSFLHTPEPTVGGTGPVFSIIGAWLIYQFQNKDVIPKDVSDSMFQKAMTVTALSFLLSHFGPVDDWTHLGAAFTGIAYGFFTCPTLQLDDGSSRNGQEERITLVRPYADPCKSFIMFTIFILVLGSFLFFLEPPLTAPGDFLYMWN